MIMADFWNETETKTRRDHLCSVCNETIPRGNSCMTANGCFDKEMFRIYFHHECLQMLKAFCCDTGENTWDADDITEYLREEYCSNCKNYDNDCAGDPAICEEIKKHFKDGAE